MFSSDKWDKPVEVSNDTSTGAIPKRMSVANIGLQRLKQLGSKTSLVGSKIKQPQDPDLGGGAIAESDKSKRRWLLLIWMEHKF